MGTHAVKVKLPGERIWRFLTPQAGVTRLRIHASLMTPERADEVARELEGLNPGVAAKVVSFYAESARDA